MMRAASRRLRGFEKTNVWSEFSGMALEFNAVNLGQGFPDWEAPSFVKDFAVKAVLENHNQYTRSLGEPNLCKSIAKMYSPFFNRTLLPMEEVTTTVGATEALFGVMQSLLDDGDEVIVLEPAFDVYPPQIQMAGGICKYWSLTPPVDQQGRWGLNIDDLEKLLSEKTKILILNTPHNPTGTAKQTDWPAYMF
jgi:kynurenine--oxoglutarate transaminase/cysteine-S-conjugate beta-lyase/glutamine--phenylpyruvate transaminase